jgi:hypothetical protein
MNQSRFLLLATLLLVPVLSAQESATPADRSDGWQVGSLAGARISPEPLRAMEHSRTERCCKDL